jgi:CRP/FNR family transcriptional regulator, cyclic AMP receptor protein
LHWTSTPSAKSSNTKEAALPEDFLGLFESETDVVALQPGEVLFRKGDAALHVYIVKSGELQILNENRILETVPAGGIVGEMALISDDGRSATARAVGECVVIPIDRKRFLFLVQQTPFFALKVMRVMCNRLKAMNQQTSVSAER